MGTAAKRRKVFGKKTRECVELSPTVCRTVFVERSHEFGEWGIWRSDLIPQKTHLCFFGLKKKHLDHSQLEITTKKGKKKKFYPGILL